MVWRRFWYLDATGIRGKLETSRMWLHMPGNPIHTKSCDFFFENILFYTSSATFSGPMPHFLSIFKRLRGRINQNSCLKLSKPFINLLNSYLFSESQFIFIFHGLIRIMCIVSPFRVERPILSLWAVSSRTLKESALHHLNEDDIKIVEFECALLSPLKTPESFMFHVIFMILSHSGSCVVSFSSYIQRI